MFINTENLNQKTDFLNGILNSLPSFNGLWFPEKIDKLPDSFFEEIANLSFQQIAKVVLSSLLKEDVSSVVDKAFNFPVKLNSIENTNLHFLETFHGPTLTFKDFGARFMATYLEEKLTDNQKYHVLVSTSGDTGSAIASAFYQKKNLTVNILYPENRISRMQELQLTTYGENVSSFGLDTSFDSCQKLVKQSFVDKELTDQINIISANSINLARLLPQCLYYFYSYAQLVKKYGRDIDNKLVFVVPCGNCGNLVGGLIAKRMGLPVKHFIAAQNDNDTLVRFLNTAEYLPKDTVKTISNAMDVGDPSNLKRIRFMYNDNIDEIRKDIKGIYISEEETKKGILEMYQQYKYVIDPHTSVAYCGYQKLKQSAEKMTLQEQVVFVSTAHPIKFGELIESVLPIKLDVHPNLEVLKQKVEEKILIKNNYNLFKKVLLSQYTKNKIKSVVFIGMPGTGKSTVSKIISNLGFDMVELDEYIETKHQMTLFKLIEKYGDEGFKKIEEDAIMSVTFDKPKVISTGGSVIYSSKGMEYLKSENNWIIYLNTSFSKLVDRTDNFTNRGIVFNGKSRKELFEERHILYQKYCDFEIMTKNLTANEISNIITNSIFMKRMI